MEPLARICLIGPEASGKTTLAAWLARAQGVPWLPEFARTYAENVRRPLVHDDVDEIARGHIAAEDALRAPRVVLDTDLVSTVVYSRHYYGSCAEWIEAAARARRADRYLLCRPDLPWTADGVRDRGDRRDELFDAFHATLEEFGAAVRVVEGSGNARLESAWIGLTV